MNNIIRTLILMETSIKVPSNLAFPDVLKKVCDCKAKGSDIAEDHDNTCKAKSILLILRKHGLVESLIGECDKPKKKKRKIEDEEDYDPKGRLTNKGLSKAIDKADYSSDR